MAGNFEANETVSLLKALCMEQQPKNLVVCIAYSVVTLSHCVHVYKEYSCKRRDKVLRNVSRIKGYRKVDSFACCGWKDMEIAKHFTNILHLRHE